MLTKTAIAVIHKNCLVSPKTNVLSEAPKVFLMATSFSFCSIINDDKANNPNKATNRTIALRIVKSVCCLLLPVGVAAGVERKVVTVGA